MSKTTVIHHSADFDGIFCREIARKFLPEAELVGWDYGDPKLQFPSEGAVYVLDLSPECFDGVPNGDGGRLIWIDHHKSAIEKFASSLAGYRIDGVAACRLAWQWFAHLAKNTGEVAAVMEPNIAEAVLPTKGAFINRNVAEPLAVRLAGEYDIWDKRDPDAELFQHGLRSRELTEAVWADLLRVPYDQNGRLGELLMGGRVVQYAKTKENEDIITHYGFTLDFEGLKFLACNHARYNSFLFTAGLKPEHDACFGFKWDNGQWSVSLYHAPGKEHHDLSKIAVKYGGGGHRGACGFRVGPLSLPFMHPSCPQSAQ